MVFVQVADHVAWRKIDSLVCLRNFGAGFNAKNPVSGCCNQEVAVAPFKYRQNVCRKGIAVSQDEWDLVKGIRCVVVVLKTIEETDKEAVSAVFIEHTNVVVQQRSRVFRLLFVNSEF